MHQNVWSLFQKHVFSTPSTGEVFNPYRDRRDDLDVADEHVMPVLSGGNLDMTMLRAVLIHALARRKQLLYLRVLIDDQPGKMSELSGLIADHDANIQTVRHDRALEDLDVGEAFLIFQVETSGAGHAENIIESIADHGYQVDVVNRVSTDRPGDA